MAGIPPFCYTERSCRRGAPMENLPSQQSEIKQLITKGREQGYLTYAEVNDHLPDDIVDPEQIEDIIGMINGMGIEVHEVAPDTDMISAEGPVSGDDDETATEEAVALLSAVDAEVGRTTDPVRMYMREMGTVELLTREGEIAIAKRIEEGLSQVQTALASFPLTIELLLEEYDQHLDGKRRLSEILAGFADLEQLADEARAEAEEAAANGELVESDEDEDEEEDEAAEEEEAGPTGPDPEEVKRRMELLRDYYAKFQKAAPKATGITDKKIVKLRPDGRGVPQAQAAVRSDRQLRAQAARGRGRHPPPRARADGHLRQAGEDAQGGVPEDLPEQRRQRRVGRRALAQAPEVVAQRQNAPRVDRRRAGQARRDREEAVPAADRHQGNQPRHVDRRGQGPPRQEGDGRGEPAPGDLHRQEVHQPRPAVPGPDPGGQHRSDEGGRQVRIPPRLQVLDLRHLVDPPGDHPLDRRPGAHHPYPGAHDRDDQQVEPHLPPDAPAVRPRADAGRAGQGDGDARGQDPQGAQDRQGTHLDGDPDRRRRGLASGRLHRGHQRLLADRVGDRDGPDGDRARRARRSHPAGSEGAAHAFRHRHEHRPHPRGSRQAVRRHPRADPPDRGEGAAQAAASEPQRAAPQLPDGRLKD